MMVEMTSVKHARKYLISGPVAFAFTVPPSMRIQYSLQGRRMKFLRVNPFRKIRR
jgi:hypothetical protein